MEFENQLLGEGAQGTVSLVKFVFPDGIKTYKGFKEAAAKFIPKRNIGEADMMQVLDHPHIVRLLGIVDAPCTPGDVERCYVLMELGEMSLLRFIADTPESLTRSLQYKWALAICEAVKYLHDKNIVHRDIKPENIILFPGDILKLTDFGISETAIATRITYRGRGTFPFLAPEVNIDTKPRGAKGQFSKASDIYALGLVLWQLLSKDDIPFPLPPEIPDEFPDSMKALLPQTWEEDPHKRPKIESIIMAVKSDNFGE